MPAGYVGILAVELHFPEAGSLKAKRKHVLSAKTQLQNRFGAAVAEVEHHDLWQRAGLGIVTVATTSAHADRELAAAAAEIDRVEPGLITRREIEFLT